ncbi:MAG: Lrp/AsnC family transcriptional regulator, partial [Pseudomonadota bacterium]
MKISDQDRKILRALQRDASQPLAKLAEVTDTAQSTLWRRINDLEASGVLKGRFALVDPAKVGAKLCVLAMVTLEDHSEEAVEDFTRLVATHPEIQECHKVSGLADYMLKIRAA